MKNTFLCLAVLTLFVLGCRKEALSPPPREIDNKPIDNEIKVVDGRLRFENYSSFKKIFVTNYEESVKILDNLQNTPGFISRKESRANVASRPTETCDCDIENDEYANSIIDEYFMVDIGDWTIKINECNQKIYALYRPAEDAQSLNDKINRMIACDFPGECFVSTVEEDIIPNLEMWEDSLEDRDYTLHPRWGCQEVAASDRNVEIGTTTNGLGVRSPEIELDYNRGWFNGCTNCYIFYTTANNTNIWHFSLEQTHYSTPCGPLLDSDVGLFSGQFVTYRGVSCLRFNEYSSNRLRAGFGTVKFRARGVLGGTAFFSPFAEILF